MAQLVPKIQSAPSARPRTVTKCSFPLPPKSIACDSKRESKDASPGDDTFGFPSVQSGLGQSNRQIWHQSSNRTLAGVSCITVDLELASYEGYESSQRTAVSDSSLSSLKSPSSVCFSPLSTPSGGFPGWLSPDPFASAYAAYGSHSTMDVTLAEPERLSPEALAPRFSGRRKHSLIDRPRPITRERSNSVSSARSERDRLVQTVLKTSKSFDRGRRQWLTAPEHLSPVIPPVPSLPAEFQDQVPLRSRPKRRSSMIDLSAKSWLTENLSADPSPFARSRRGREISATATDLSRANTYTFHATGDSRVAIFNPPGRARHSFIRDEVLFSTISDDVAPLTLYNPIEADAIEPKRDHTPQPRASRRQVKDLIPVGSAIIRRLKHTFPRSKSRRS